ncbi:hypothetical protein KCP69_12125 [Salmonella enterica subsp. enterica]|nr:hypothetical protein KCP69_12125 [Salmonella enterica subsp. enterica]
MKLYSFFIVRRLIVYVCAGVKRGLITRRWASMTVSTAGQRRRPTDDESGKAGADAGRTDDEDLVGAKSLVMSSTGWTDIFRKRHRCEQSVRRAQRGAEIVYVSPAIYAISNACCAT